MSTRSFRRMKVPVSAANERVELARIRRRGRKIFRWPRRLRAARAVVGLALALAVPAACGSSSTPLEPPDCPDVLQAGLTAATSCVPTHGAVEGRVIDAADGEPIVGALVATNPSTKTALTDAGGRFEIEGIALEDDDRRLSVTASKAGFVSASTEFELGTESARVEVQLTLSEFPPRRVLFQGAP